MPYPVPEVGLLAGLGGLFVATLTPLVLTLGSDEPVANTAGVLLALALARLTLNPWGPAPTEYDKTMEQQAVQSIVMTSPANQNVRLLLGSLYVYAALSFASRMLRADPTLLATLLQLDMGALQHLGLTWVGCLLDFYIGGVWLSSGWCGQ